jgi:hypothetical protein
VILRDLVGNDRAIGPPLDEPVTDELLERAREALLAREIRIRGALHEAFSSFFAIIASASATSMCFCTLPVALAGMRAMTKTCCGRL